MFRVAEDHRAVAKSSASRDSQGGLGVQLRLRRVQPGAHAEPGQSGCSTRLSRGGSAPAGLEASPPADSAQPNPPTQQRNTREGQRVSRVHQFFSSLLEAEYGRH